jgi:CheY-like chemotaxis protein
MAGMNKPIHILVVDDDSDVREVLEAMLETSACHVSGVNGGKAMREFLATEGRNSWRSEPICLHVASIVRSPALRRSVLSLAKTCSIGLRSGE